MNAVNYWRKQNLKITNSSLVVDVYNRSSKNVHTVYYLIFTLAQIVRDKEGTMFVMQIFCPFIMNQTEIFNYLAQKLCFWRGIIFIGVYLSVCVCVCGCISINSKSSQPIFLKFGRMVYNDNSSIPFEDEIDRVDRTQTLPKRVVKIDIKATYL